MFNNLYAKDKIIEIQLNSIADSIADLQRFGLDLLGDIVMVLCHHFIHNIVRQEKDIHLVRHFETALLADILHTIHKFASQSFG